MRIFATKERELHYSSKEIDRTKAIYRVIIGQRSNGKTYCTIRKALEAYCKKGLPSAYIRRYAEEIRPKFIFELLAPHKDYIVKLTKGRYNDYTFKNNEFHLCYYDAEKHEVTERDNNACIFCTALNTWNTSKGVDRGNLIYIIFDEFMTRDLYLQNEFVKFTNCLSSLIRDRSGVVIYMLANTVNKYCPYFEEMGLYHVPEQEQGTIELYNYNNKLLTVAVEYCLPAEATKEVLHYYAFDNPAVEMIKTGLWEEDRYRHVTDCKFDLTKETELFRFLVDFNKNKVVGEIHSKGNHVIIFYHPVGNSNRKWTDNDVVYSDSDNSSLTWAKAFSMGSLDVHKMIYNIMKQHNDYYDTNSTGEIINNFMKWGGGK